MSELAITFLCPIALEEKLFDLLLLDGKVRIFTSMATAVHGVSHDKLDQAELVLGRARATSVQVIFDAAEKDNLLSRLRREFNRTGLRYWLTPVLESGEIF
jgi:Protein of unknown function (DUF3240)